MRRFLRPAVAGLLLAAAALPSLEAMPAFGRRYSLSCKTCHSPFPKLKPYGEEFAANAFSIKDKDTPRYAIDTGDDQLSLLRELPFALRLEGFWTYNNGNRGQVDFSSPYILKLLSGGEIAKNIGYYFYFFFSERGEIAGLEDAFVVFNDLFGGDLDLYVGQFQVSDPLFKREVRLSFEDYAVYKATPGESRINLAYDRGLMLTYGLPTGTDFALEILNGTGIGEANIFRNFDDDKFKNLLFRISQDAGEAARLGAFGYTGKERVRGVDNSVWMLGADATFALAPLELNLQYVERGDSTPFFSPSAPAEVRTRGALAELVVRPGGDDGKWYGLGLFNWVESDLPELDYGSASLHVGRLLRRNLRLVGELTWVVRGPEKKFARLGAGFVTAF